MTEIETLVPIIIGSIFINVIMILLFFIHRKYIGLWFSRVLKRNVGNELLIFDEENSTVETVFVRSPADYGFGETVVQKITETIPGNVINPVKINKIPFIRDKNFGFPVRLFFKKSREEWNPFSKVPNLANRQMRSNNYLNVWNTSAAYNRALGGGNFNKIVLILLGLVIILIGANLKLSSDINDGLLNISKKLDTFPPIFDTINKGIIDLGVRITQVNNGLVGIVRDLPGGPSG